MTHETLKDGLENLKQEFKNMIVTYLDPKETSWDDLGNEGKPVLKAKLDTLRGYLHLMGMSDHDTQAIIMEVRAELKNEGKI